MAEDPPRKIIVDDDWKAQAQKEKERLARETEQKAGPGAMPGPLPGPSFVEAVNLIVMQAMVGLGLVAGPGGERIPPNLEMAKHYIDLLDVLEQKTQGNLTEDEKKLLDQVLYDLRLRYVEMASGSAAAGGPVSTPPASPGA